MCLNPRTSLDSFTELNFSCKRGFLITAKAASCAGQKSLPESSLHLEPLLLCQDWSFDSSKENPWAPSSQEEQNQRLPTATATVPNPVDFLLNFSFFFGERWWGKSPIVFFQGPSIFSSQSRFSCVDCKVRKLGCAWNAFLYAFLYALKINCSGWNYHILWYADEVEETKDLKTFFLSSS